MGKTTLLAALLAKMQKGGELAGLHVPPGQALVVSEENPGHWAYRAQRFGLTGHCLMCQPFHHKPTAEDWSALIASLAEQGRERKFALAVIDTLATFLPGHGESNAGMMLDALLPLQALTDLGMAVLLLHHPRKGETLDGQSARGTGALPGHVDILIEMQWVGRPTSDDRRRRLLAWSRQEETPRRRALELDAAGTDYVVVPDAVTRSDGRDLSMLLEALASFNDWPTQEELLARWPEDLPRPGAITLWRWLGRALADGLIQRRGGGGKKEPYRYGVMEVVP